MFSSILVLIFCISSQVLSTADEDTRELQIVSRSEWMARRPRKPLTPIRTPVPYVIISHTATSKCFREPVCSAYVRNIQTFHMAQKGEFDIAYNFLVGGDGCAYEGRGWEYQGGHTKGYNSNSFGLAFIGEFHVSLPPSRQIEVAQQLIARGVENGYIAKDYKLLGARQVTQTLSPGAKLFENIKTWPHWSEKP